jgi:glycosyltransferase involved in cell wall biosynthesis
VLLAWLARCPAWATAHGIEVWDLKPGLKRWGILHLQRLLPVSRFTGEQLQRQLGRHCPPQSVLPNAYNDEQFRPGPANPALLERYGLHPDQPVIFCLTRLTRLDRNKHVRALIAAMPELLKRFPDLCLLIGGSGDDLDPLREEVNRLDLARHILLPGAIDAAELPDHYRLARVFALPSEKEGFGIVFLEAAGSGCTVLAGNRDGSVDPLQNGRFGCLVDPRLPLAPPLQALLEGCGEPLWHQPQALSAAVAEAFALPAFRQRLHQLLSELPALMSL